MNQSQHQQQSWQAQRQRDADHKKLFALHSQNKRLRQQQQQSQIAIHDYIRKVNLFNHKSLTLEQQNLQLKKQVQSLNAANIKIQALLSKRNEDYCSLYNYLFTEKRGSVQDLFMKEMDLNNRLNEIQHESDSQIIEKLRSAIKSKNQELLKYAQRNNELSQALAASSYEYQQQINAIRSQKAREVQIISIQYESISDYSSNKKIDGLRREIELYKQQLLTSNNELNYLRNVSSQLQKINTLLENEIQAIKSHQPHLTTSIFDILQENRVLKENYEKEREKYQLLIQGMPDLSEKITTYIDAEQSIAQQRKAINKLKGQMATKEQQAKHLREQNEKMRQQNKDLQLKYSSLEIVSTSCFLKFKKLIEAYIPYYLRKDGFDNYNLTEEEANFLAERNVEATLLKIKKEISKKTVEWNNLKRENSTLERSLIAHQEKISQLEKDVAEKQIQIKKLQESTKSLLQKYSCQQRQSQPTHSYATFKPHHEPSQQRYQMGSDESSPNFGYQNESHQQSPQHQFAPKQRQNEYMYEDPVQEISEKKRIQILQRAIEEIQADRNELIQIIQRKDVSLIKFNSQIRVLRTVENNRIDISLKGQLPQLHLLNEESAAKSNETEIQEVRSQLRKLSDQYRKEKDFIIREYQRRQGELRDKYMNLLKTYDQLSIKYNALQPEKKPEVIQDTQNQNNEIVNQEQEIVINNEIVHEVAQEQSIISETAIQNFTDVLKKYEKEFNKYVTVYEYQIKKSLKPNIRNEQMGQETVYSQDYVQRLQAVIDQHQEAIANLQNALNQKQRQSLVKINELQDQLKAQKEVASQLSDRLQEQNKLLNGLREQVLLQKANLEFGSAESANSAFATLDLKNKQIEGLKHNVEKAKQSYEDKCKEITKIRELTAVHSQIEAEEYRLLRDIIYQQDLVGVLQGVVHRLE